jgi:hypothetical protein
MTGTDFLDELISKIDPIDIPVEYLVMAHVIDSDGNQFSLYGQEIKDVLENPDIFGVSEVRVLVNVKRIREEILEDMRDILMNVEEYALNRGS